MIKWVTVLVHIPSGEIHHVRECGSPFRDDENQNIRNIQVENQAQYRQKTFCVECDKDVNANWLLQNLEDDARPDSIPSLKANLPVEVTTKIQRRITEEVGNLDYDDRRSAYRELLREMPEQAITDADLFAKVDDLRSAR